MFNLGFSELIILGVVALIFIGPEQLPQVARTIGRLLNEWKRATSDFQETITTHITEEVQGRITESRQDHSNLESGMGDQIVAHPDDGNAGDLPAGAHPVSEKDKKS